MSTIAVGIDKVSVHRTCCKGCGAVYHPCKHLLVLQYLIDQSNMDYIAIAVSEQVKQAPGYLVAKAVALSTIFATSSWCCSAHPMTSSRFTQDSLATMGM